MNLIINEINAYLAILPKDTEKRSKQFFSTESFLSQLVPASYTVQDLLLLDQYCRKIDVKKALYSEYSLNLEIVENSSVLSTESIERMVCHLLLAFLQAKDYKFLNTVLKLRDGVLKTPSYQMGLGLRSLMGRVMYECL